MWLVAGCRRTVVQATTLSKPEDQYLLWLHGHGINPLPTCSRGVRGIIAQLISRGNHQFGQPCANWQELFCAVSRACCDHQFGQCYEMSYSLHEDQNFPCVLRPPVRAALFRVRAEEFNAAVGGGGRGLGAEEEAGHFQGAGGDGLIAAPWHYLARVGGLPDG